MLFEMGSVAFKLSLQFGFTQVLPALDVMPQYRLAVFFFDASVHIPYELAKGSGYTACSLPCFAS
jgi:hypothetical protein